MIKILSSFLCNYHHFSYTNSSVCTQKTDEKATIELGAISKELNHKYWNHWSDNTRLYTKSRYFTHSIALYAYGY